MLDVIIPLDDRLHYTKGIFNDIEKNTVIPDNIIVIDNATTNNTVEFLIEMKKRLPIIIIRNEVNLGVNASWNLGITLSQAEYISILNNDIAIPTFFFEKNLDAFNQNKQIGLIFANHNSSAQYVREIIKPNENKLDFRQEGLLFPCSPELQGYAFTIKKDLIINDLIPKEFFTFYGDLYWFMSIEKQGYYRVIMLDVPVHHYGGGASFEAMTNTVKIKAAKREDEIWKKYWEIYR